MINRETRERKLGHDADTLYAVYLPNRHQAPKVRALMGKIMRDPP